MEMTWVRDALLEAIKQRIAYILENGCSDAKELEQLMKHKEYYEKAKEYYESK
jgi:hypothetical protein